VGSARSNLSPFCTALWPERFGSYDGNQLLGIEGIQWENTAFTEFTFFFIGSKCFIEPMHNCWDVEDDQFVSVCASFFLMGLDPTFGFDRLHSWTLRYVATEKWKDFTVGNRKFVLKFSGSEIPAITHVVPKTNVDIHVPLRGKLIPLFSEHY